MTEPFSGKWGERPPVVFNMGIKATEYREDSASTERVAEPKQPHPRLAQRIRPRGTSAIDRFGLGILRDKSARSVFDRGDFSDAMTPTGSPCTPHQLSSLQLNKNFLNNNNNTFY